MQGASTFWDILTLVDATYQMLPTGAWNRKRIEMEQEEARKYGRKECAPFSLLPLLFIHSRWRKSSGWRGRSRWAIPAILLPETASSFGFMNGQAWTCQILWMWCVGWGAVYADHIPAWFVNTREQSDLISVCELHVKFTQSYTFQIYFECLLNSKCRVKLTFTENSAKRSSYIQYVCSSNSVNE